MSGVIAAMRRAWRHNSRRRWLSCTVLARCIGPLAAAAPVTLAASAAHAESWFGRLPSLVNLERHEFAALTTALAVLAYAVFATVLLMRTRVRSTETETLLRSRTQALQTESDRLRALLFAEPQVLIAWPAAEDRPQISGDVSLLLPHQGSDQQTRVLAFGAWLHPEPALQIERAVEALRNDGESFTLHLTTSVGRSIEAIGRAIGGQAILRIRELSGLRRDYSELAQKHKTLLAETEILQTFATAVPAPVWTRDASGRLGFANAAYAKATEATSPADAMARNLDLLDTAGREDMANAIAASGSYSARLPVAIRGERRMFDVRALRVGDASAGIAIDVTEAAALKAALVRMAEAHRRTLDQLSSGVAIFDGEKRLSFYNDSYRRLWDLDRALLDSFPDDSRVLDQLRASRKIAEQQDFRGWKAKLHEAYRAVEPAKDMWHLPDGRTVSVVTTPNPEGGVTYLFDDVTESLNLARRFDRLIRVQRESLDNLAEAVAVFGSNGRAQLFNPAFAKMWRLPADELERQPHIEVVEAWCRPLCDDARAWQTLRNAVTSIESREPVPLRLERTDGSVLDCMTMPLPDGATMLTFQDITDTVNVERALRERNEALETTGQMKVDFVHHVSYELRSPLTTIIGFAHFLSDPSTGPLTEKQAEYLNYITSSTDALLALINNILDLATIDAGEMTLDLGEVDIRDAIEQAAAGIQDRLTRDHIQLDIEADRAPGKFVADEKRVVQVLYNLLANAVGFSPPDGTITVTASRSDDAIRFAVSDAGPGIAENLKDKVFEWFATSANGSRHRGAGLGLSLVRSFVELHGGRVQVDSSPGKGTTVTCDFPLDQRARVTGYIAAAE